MKRNRNIENKPVYSKDDKVILKDTGREVKILDVRDGRDYSDIFRPDWKDGLEYEIIDEKGDVIYLHWWDFND